MLTSSTRLGLAIVVAFAGAGLARPAPAQSSDAVATVRESRSVSVALAPSGPLARQFDSGRLLTIPLPAVRVGVNVSPRLMLDLTATTLPLDSYVQTTLIDLGARWFLDDANGSPYLMARSGAFFVTGSENEVDVGTYGYVTLGAGAEWADDNGLTLWAEVGPALVYGHRTGWGGYASVGVGYRFGSAPARPTSSSTPVRRTDKRVPVGPPGKREVPAW
jgi:hypothetical protein